MDNIFPIFKTLEIKDKNTIESFTRHFDPYGDFDFANMWSWHTDGEVKFSFLNENLVLVLPEYYSNKPSYTFIGTQQVDETVKTLFLWLDSQNQQLKLNVIPEVVLRNISMEKFLIEIDFDNSDYVYDLEALSNYSGSLYAKKRKALASFLKKWPDVSTKQLDIRNHAHLSELTQLAKIWMENKNQKNDNKHYLKENSALEKFLATDFNDALCLGVYNKNQLIGFSIFRLLHNNYATCYFSKIDVNYIGANEYLMNQTGKLLLQGGYKYLNYEEDLGLPGLRFSKNSFRPSHFLRKYSIRPLLPLEEV